MLPFSNAMLMAGQAGGGGTPFSNKGALVHVTDFSGAALSAADVPYGNIDYDVQGWRTSSTTFTTPTLPAGTLMRLFTSYFVTASEARQHHLKGGSTFLGFGAGSVPPLAGSGATWSAIIPAVAAETFTSRSLNATNFQGDGRNWMGVEIIKPGTRYTLSVLASSQTVVSANGDKIFPWTHSIDTMGSHNNTTNPSRHTVPADTTGKVRFTANSTANALAGSATESRMTVFKNGSAYNCRDQVHLGSNDVGVWHHVVTPIMDVVSGDYFEVAHLTNAGTLSYGAADNGVWVCFEELPADVRYVLVNRATDLSLVNGDNAVAFDGEVHDPEGCHDTVTNPADIVVPTGATSARCSSAHDITSGPTIKSWITRTRSGTTIVINGGGSVTADNSAVLNDNCAFGCWFDVQAGDILRLHINCDQSSKSLLANAFTWFQVEFQ